MKVKHTFEAQGRKPDDKPYLVDSTDWNGYDNHILSMNISVNGTFTPPSVEQPTGTFSLGDLYVTGVISTISNDRGNTPKVYIASNVVTGNPYDAVTWVNLVGSAQVFTQNAGTTPPTSTTTLGQYDVGNILIIGGETGNPVSYVLDSIVKGPPNDVLTWLPLNTSIWPLKTGFFIPFKIRTLTTGFVQGVYNYSLNYLRDTTGVPTAALGLSVGYTTVDFNTPAAIVNKFIASFNIALATQTTTPVLGQKLILLNPTANPIGIDVALVSNSPINIPSLTDSVYSSMMNFTGTGSNPITSIVYNTNYGINIGNPNPTSTTTSVSGYTRTGTSTWAKGSTTSGDVGIYGDGTITLTSSVNGPNAISIGLNTNNPNYTGNYITSGDIYCYNGTSTSTSDIYRVNSNIAKYSLSTTPNPNTPLGINVRTSYVGSGTYDNNYYVPLGFPSNVQLTNSGFKQTPLDLTVTHNNTINVGGTTYTYSIWKCVSTYGNLPIALAVNISVTWCKPSNLDSNPTFREIGIIGFKGTPPTSYTPTTSNLIAVNKIFIPGNGVDVSHQFPYTTQNLTTQFILDDSQSSASLQNYTQFIVYARHNAASDIYIGRDTTSNTDVLVDNSQSYITIHELI